MKVRGRKLKVVKGAKPPLKGNAIIIDGATQNPELAKLVADKFGHFGKRARCALGNLVMA